MSKLGADTLHPYPYTLPMISLKGLNPNQRKAAETVKGPVLILAGAGSGKTRTITVRVAHMIENLGIPARNILGISFTNKAAGEMRERVGKLLGKKKTKGITLSTFHSLGLRILKEEIIHLGYSKGFAIYDTSDQVSIVREALKNFKTEKSYDHKQILSKIGFLKNKGLTEDEFANSPYFDSEDMYDHATEHVYHYYQDRLKFYNAIDFDDILLLTARLFREQPQIKKKYSELFQYIMVDEYQDTNPLQFELIRALTSTHNNICVVGDDDQSIYAFRGADISNILSFEKMYKGATVVKLEQNYRSTAPILELANEIIKVNPLRKEKRMWTSMSEGSKPSLWATGDTDHEAAVVADEVSKLRAQGVDLNECAILVRSSTQMDALEDQLKIMMIPYKVVGGQKFYERKEVKDLLAYLSLINSTKNEISLRRVLNVPARGIGRTSLQKFIDFSQQNKMTLYNALKGQAHLASKSQKNIENFCELITRLQILFKTKSLSEAVEGLITEINYFSHVEKTYEKAGQIEHRKNDVRRFIDSCKRFEKFFPNAGLYDFLEKMLLQDSQDDRDKEEAEQNSELSVMTLHSSKGLEFDHVFLVGMEEETLPHKRTIQLGEDISEERRLAYVGITRARKQLVMTYSKERKLYGKMIERHPSRFLMGLDEHFIRQDRTCFGHMSEQEAQEYKSDFFTGLSALIDE